MEAEKLIEKLSQEQNESSKVVRVALAYAEFASLVKKMREAQEELDVFEHEHEFFDYKAIMKRKELTSKVIKLESEVDEHLKKMEI